MPYLITESISRAGVVPPAPSTSSPGISGPDVRIGGSCFAVSYEVTVLQKIQEVDVCSAYDFQLHVCVRAMTLPSNDLMPSDNLFFEIMNGWRST